MAPRPGGKLPRLGHELHTEGLQAVSHTSGPPRVPASAHALCSYSSHPLSSANDRAGSSHTAGARSNRKRQARTGSTSPTAPLCSDPLGTRDIAHDHTERILNVSPLPSPRFEETDAARTR